MGTIVDLNELTAPDSEDFWVVRDVSDVTDKDKKVKLGKFPLKGGTPVAGHIASWLDTGTVQDGGLVATDLYQKTQVYLVDKNFTNDPTAKRFNTIGAAVTAAPANCTIQIGPGTYTENVTLAQHGTRLIGGGKSRFDGTNLVGGTLVVGQVNINGKNGCEVRSLGVDVRTFSGSEKDAILDNRAAPADAYNSYVDL